MVKKKRALIVQPHHIRYPDDPKGEWVVPMYKGEHWVMGQLNRRKNVSLGFITALEEWIGRNVEKAVAVCV